MPVSDRDHFDALRASDQRAVELLAKANAAKSHALISMISLLIALASILVAIYSAILPHPGSHCP